MWYLTWTFIHVSETSAFNSHVTEEHDLLLHTTRAVSRGSLELIHHTNSVEKIFRY